jgi:hypothetical protein
MVHDRRIPVSMAKSMLGCSDDFVRDLIADQALDAIDIRRAGAPRALWSISLDSVRRYISQRRRGAKKDPLEPLGQRDSSAGAAEELAGAV